MFSDALLFLDPVLAHVREFPLLLLLNVPIFALIVVLYRLTLHPLSGFPGPRLWAVSRLPYAYYWIRGTLHYRLAELFDEYGHVIRIAPGELAFTHEDTWNDVYFTNRDGNLCPRDPAVTPDIPEGGKHGIIMTLNEDDHARMRRILAPSFSESALRKQETFFSVYIDLLIQRLRENAGKPIDIWQWINLTTFDITSDLTFGESLECLENSTEHEWVIATFGFLKALAFFSLTARFSPLQKLLKMIVPKSVMDKERQHRALVSAKLDRRLADQNARPDFLSTAQATLGKPQGMTLGELRETAAILIPAGSETSATSMAGTLRLLLTNPSKLQIVTDEIRNSFRFEQDITMQYTRERLPYLHAVIEESLRLFPPAAVAFTIYRVTPDEGATIAGRYVPGKTVVAVAAWAAFRSKRYFADPEAFVPERWLEGKQCPERYRDDKRKAVQAFGVGPRSCIGKPLAYVEMRLILTRILWNFDIELCEKNQAWGFERKSKVFIVWDHDRLMVKVTPVKR